MASEYTPAERVRRTVLLAGDIEKVRQIRAEARLVVASDRQWNAFFKSRGYDPAAWEGLIAGLKAGNLIVD